MEKQNMFDFLDAHQKEIIKQKPEIVFDSILQKNKKLYPPNYLVTILDEYRGIAIMKYPPRPMEQFLHPEEGAVLPRFEYELIATDFPWRNKIPCYKSVDGKGVLSGWIDGEDAKPSLALQRFLDSGEKLYIPKYKPRSADATNENVSKLLTHGKYHFGSSANI